MDTVRHICECLCLQDEQAGALSHNYQKLGRHMQAIEDGQHEVGSSDVAYVGPRIKPCSFCR